MTEWPSIERTRRRGLALAAVLAVAVGLLAYLTPFLDGFEADSVDKRFSVRPAERVDDIVFVDVDDVSFDKLEKRWPLPRDLHAKVARRLHKAGSGEIIFDIQFTEPSENQDEDFALFDALGAVGGAVLATTESDSRGRTAVLGGEKVLRQINSVAGAANLPDETGGVLRKFPYAEGRLRSIATVVAARKGRPLALGQFEDGKAWIDFAGPQDTVPSISYVDVLDGSFDAAAVRGRMVIIGSSAPSVQDLHRTPTSGDSFMAGPEIQANAIRTALRGLPLRTAPRWLDVLSIVLLALLIPLLGLFTRALRAVLAAPLLAALFVAANYLAFTSGTVLVAAAPLAALFVSVAGTVMAGYLFETRERRRVAEYNGLLAQRVRERTEEVRATQLELIERLSRAVELRDEETGGHVQRISRMAEELAVAVGLPAEEAEHIRDASALHDIGKIGVPDAILLKAGPLDAAERALMQRHTVVGSDLLGGSSSPTIQLAEEIARTHHERWDGAGYPNGLAGTDIPIAGRICAVVDVFDALTSKRPYKEAWTVDAALDELERQSGKHFDPALIEAFIALRGRGGSGTVHPFPTSAPEVAAA